MQAGYCCYTSSTSNQYWRYWLLVEVATQPSVALVEVATRPSAQVKARLQPNFSATIQ